MEKFTSLFKKEHRGELVLAILFVIYLVLGFKTPEMIANVVDTIFGKAVMFVIIVYMFLYGNPILAVLSIFVAFDLIRRASMSTGFDALQKYAPTEDRKMSQLSAYNQFPYTLEQEMVNKMAPIVQSSYMMTPATYKPILENLHDASPVTSSI